MRRLRKQVLVAMSGGVDSSVAAYLLKQEGYDVTGVTMCLGSGADDRARCCGPEAIEDARRVCHKLAISHYVFEFAGELEEKVIGKFVSEYREGRTPNPCIDCNRYLKFGSLLEKSRALGFDYIATGHYADMEQRKGGVFLKRPRDKTKDQTYFLYGIPPGSMERILFPLASLRKEEVRSIAASAGLPVADKPESQDLCFVDRKRFADFVSRWIPGMEPGPIVDRKNRQLGMHRGIVHYTIGQRSGLGIAHPVPLYVLSIDPAGNRIVVGERSELRVRGLVAGDLNILMEHWPSEISAKTRYRREAGRCDVSFVEKGVRVIFHEGEEAVSPGQAVVFYHGDYVLGGGTIEDRIYGHCSKN